MKVLATLWYIWVMANRLPQKSLENRRIELRRCTDAHTSLKPGDRGTVVLVDDAGTVHVKWDNGNTLGLCWEAGDRWNILVSAKPYSYAQPEVPKPVDEVYAGLRRLQRV